MKQLHRILIAVATLGLALPALAADNVSATKHNLSTSGTGQYAVTAGTDEVCVFCHTPHAANTTVGVALWNKGTPNTAGYVMYSNTTIDMTIAATPQGVSLACLSCHDGTLAIDNMINGPGSGSYTAAGAAQGSTYGLGGANVNTAPTGLTQDLSNDHPISITYDNSATGDTAFNSIAAVNTAGIPLYGTGSDQVECGSCHNPHEATLPTFYRISNAASAMCTTCHIK